MTGMDDLIGQLAADAAPRRAGGPWKMFGIWVLAAVIYAGLILAFYLHPRADLLAKFSEPLFGAEIFTLAGLALSSIFAAAVLSFPDMHQKRRALDVPFVFFGMFCWIMFSEWRSSGASTEIPSGMECLVCITSLSVLPALLMFYQIRKMAPTRPAYAGAAATLAAFAIGALTLRLSENTDSVMHLVIWHYAPMLAAAAIGICLGRKLLRW